MTISDNSETEKMDYFRGTGERWLAFSDLDQKYHLKHRAFIEICMSPIFTELERKFPMIALRKKGIVPIMFYLDFQTEPTPLSFGRKVKTEYGLAIHRTEPEQASGTRRRLLLDVRTIVKAYRGSGSAAAFGLEKEKGALELVGACQVLQVFTRPLAPAGERGVTELPGELQGFNVLPWQAPYPTVEMLLAGPDGWTEADKDGGGEFTAVWSMANTDVNQHINVEEYISHTENHSARLLHAAGLPLALHRNRRAQLVFRRPFFAGEDFGLRGRLWLREEQTLCVAGLHSISPQGEWSPRPNVAARYEGQLEEG